MNNRLAAALGVGIAIVLLLDVFLLVTGRVDGGGVPSATPTADSTGPTPSRTDLFASPTESPTFASPTDSSPDASPTQVESPLFQPTPGSSPDGLPTPLTSPDASPTAIESPNPIPTTEPVAETGPAMAGMLPLGILFLLGAAAIPQVLRRPR